MIKLSPHKINEIGISACIVLNKYQHALRRPRFWPDDQLRIPELDAMSKRLYDFESEFIVYLLSATQSWHLDSYKREFDELIAEADALNRSLTDPTDPNEVYGEMEAGIRWPRLYEFAGVDDCSRYEEIWEPWLMSKINYNNPPECRACQDVPESDEEFALGIANPKAMPEQAPAWAEENEDEIPF